jgi:hypothetical protein
MREVRVLRWTSWSWEVTRLGLPVRFGVRGVSLTHVAAESVTFCSSRSIIRQGDDVSAMGGSWDRLSGAARCRLPTGLG